MVSGTPPAHTAHAVGWKASGPSGGSTLWTGLPGRRQSCHMGVKLNHADPPAVLVLPGMDAWQARVEIWYREHNEE